MGLQRLNRSKSVSKSPTPLSEPAIKLPEHPVLQLQAARGNRSVNQWLAAQQKTSDTQQPIQAKFQGLFQELMGESQQRLVPTPTPSSLTTPTSGKPMPASVQQKMETSFNADFSDVRIHEGSEAESIGAIAYAQGQDIYFAPSQYAPMSQAGQQLLGHELAHVVQQRAGQVIPSQSNTSVNLNPTLESEADTAGRQAAQGQPTSLQIRSEGHLSANQGSPGERGVVQAKLPWNRQTFEQVAGTKTGRSEEYKTIIRLLESLDRPPIVYFQNPLYNHAQATLADLQEACFVWLEKNQNKQSEKVSNRRLVIEQLAYRDIPKEVAAVEGSYRGVLTGQSLGKGQVSSGGVKKAQFQRGRGAFKAAEESYDPDAAAAARDAGIPAQHGSLLSNRAVAASQLDRLFQTNILVHTEFGMVTDPQTQQVVHGIAMEKAAGVSPQTSYMLEFTGAPELDSSVEFSRGLNYNDSGLLKQLSTLQLLDAITGQVDRHPGNYFVSQGGSQGTQVKGIDNDFAFGAKNMDVAKESSSHDKYQGFPVYVDQTVAQNIRAVSEDQVRKVLRPLLPKAEVENTIQRFRQVLQGLKILENSGRLITGNQWDDPAVFAAHGDKTYFGVAKASTDLRAGKGQVIAYDPKEDENTHKTRENSYINAYLLIQLVLTTSSEEIAAGQFGSSYKDKEWSTPSIDKLRRRVLEAARVLLATNPPKALQDRIKAAFKKVDEIWLKNFQAVQE